VAQEVYKSETFLLTDLGSGKSSYENLRESPNSSLTKVCAYEMKCRKLKFEKGKFLSASAGDKLLVYGAGIEGKYLVSRRVWGAVTGVAKCLQGEGVSEIRVCKTRFAQSVWWWQCLGR
jgi:hypothetical protein